MVLEKWPEADKTKMREMEVKMVIQINGKVRAVLQSIIGSDQAEVESLARSSLDVEKWLLNKEIKKTIFVPDKLLNFVVA